jgi:hypothetical protein
MSFVFENVLAFSKVTKLIYYEFIGARYRYIKDRYNLGPLLLY